MVGADGVVGDGAGAFIEVVVGAEGAGDGGDDEAVGIGGVGSRCDLGVVAVSIGICIGGVRVGDESIDTGDGLLAVLDGVVVGVIIEWIGGLVAEGGVGGAIDFDIVVEVVAIRVSESGVGAVGEDFIEIVEVVSVRVGSGGKITGGDVAEDLGFPEVADVVVVGVIFREGGRGIGEAFQEIVSIESGGRDVGDQ